MSSRAVIVIGAGCAGLADAAALHRRGVGVTVLEARPRIGGRILTLRPPALSVPVELGAELVHGVVPEILELLVGRNAPAAELCGEAYQAEAGRVRPAGDFFRRVRSVVRRFDPELEPDTSVRGFLIARGLERELPDAVPLALRYVEGFHAGDVDRMSARALARIESADQVEAAARSFRVAGGYDVVPAALAAELPAATLRLGQPVERVRWRPGAVRVLCRGAEDVELAADAAIVTLPVGVLKAGDGEAGRVAFEPPLEDKRAALDHLEMGAVVRLALAFDEPFWERGLGGTEPLERLGFLHTPAGLFNVFWTPFPLRAPLLVAWAGGPRAARLAREHGDDDDALARVALGELARATGVPEHALHARLRGRWRHAWELDPASRGAYAYPLVGGADAFAELTRPLAGTLFFAGEACAGGGRNGTVDGAVASGRQAAAALLRALDPRGS